MKIAKHSRRAAARGCSRTAQEPIVPIEREVRHVLKFQNKHARLFDAEGQTPIVDNERIRVTRLMLAPGESRRMHVWCGMLVAVSQAQLACGTAGPEHKVAMRPAHFKWHDAYTPWCWSTSLRRSSSDFSARTLRPLRIGVGFSLQELTIRTRAGADNAGVRTVRTARPEPRCC